MSPWRNSPFLLALFWSIVSILGQLPPPSTSAKWKSFPLTGKNHGFEKNSGTGQKMSSTTRMELFHQIHGSESERLAAEKMPGKPEEPGKGKEESDRMTHGKIPTDVEVENVDPSEPLKSDEQSEFETGKTRRRREKTLGRRWRQNGANILGKKSKTNARETITKWGENSPGVFRAKRTEGERKEKRKWGENTLRVWGKRSDREKARGDDLIHADDALKEQRPEADGSKPEMTTIGANDRGNDVIRRRMRQRRSSGDIDEDSIGWYPAADAAVSYLSKRSKPRRRSLPAPYDGPKRTWETNTMKVWGKRSGAKPTWEEYFYNNNNAEPISGKRRWTSNNAIRIWGKRDPMGPMPPPNDEETFFSRLYDTYGS